MSRNGPKTTYESNNTSTHNKSHNKSQQAKTESQRVKNEGGQLAQILGRQNQKVDP